jgi:hypothetical protein
MRNEASEAPYIDAELPRPLRGHPFAEGEFSSGNHTPLLLSFREEGELGTLMLTQGVMFVALFAVS